MWYAEPSFPACHSDLWSHINGWEVVAAVFFIITGWAVTSVARMYFMWRIAESRPVVKKLVDSGAE
jgi:hypothetical protein